MAQLPGEDRIVQYIASSGQISFSYGFEIYIGGNSDVPGIKVQQGSTLLTYITDYTVTGAGEEAGGTVELVVGASLDDIITITANTFIERETIFQQSGDYLASAINEEYDLLDAITSELLTAHDQVLNFDPPIDGFDMSLPLPDAGKAIKFNEAENGFILTEHDPDEAQNNAAISAAAALVSENNAADSETAAGISETNAALSAAEAAISAAEAAASAASIDLTALGSDIIPDVDETRDLGSATHKWAEIHTKDLAVAGDLTGGADTDIIINTDKFTVDGATGDTVIAGTLTVGGVEFGVSNAANYSYNVPYNTDGGNYPVGETWQTRPFNTENYDDIGITLDSNALTLPSGKYTYSLEYATYDMTRIKVRIRKTDATAITLHDSITEYSSGDTTGISSGAFTLSTSSVIEVQIFSPFADLNNQANGKANALTEMGDNIYINLTIVRISNA